MDYLNLNVPQPQGPIYKLPVIEQAFYSAYGEAGLSAAEIGKAFAGTTKALQMARDYASAGYHVSASRGKKATGPLRAAWTLAAKGYYDAYYGSRDIIVQLKEANQAADAAKSMTGDTIPFDPSGADKPGFFTMANIGLMAAGLALLWVTGVLKIPKK